MYIHFRYKNGSNPYISTTNKSFFKMLAKYYINQVGARDFEVIERREEEYKKTYSNMRRILKAFAICWQSDFYKCHYSWNDVADWGAFFEEYGKKYGLLREFRENGII